MTVILGSILSAFRMLRAAARVSGAVDMGSQPRTADLDVLGIPAAALPKVR